MNQPGPRNGYSWTPREMMMRRDHIRWRNAHTALLFAPVSTIILGFPIGTVLGVPTFVLSFVVQSYYAYGAFSDGRHQFSAPILIQRIVAGLTIAAGVCVGALGGLQNLNAAFGGMVWLLILWWIEASSRRESEIDRANREAMHVEQTWIKE